MAVANVLKVGISLALIAALGLLATYQSFYTLSSLLGPLHFLRTYPASAWPNIIAILLMLAVAGVLWLGGVARRRPIIEVLAVLAIASLVPGLLLRIEAGGAYYFINIGTWIAIVFAAGMLLVPALAGLDRPVLTTVATAAIGVIALLSQPQLRESAAKFSAMLGALDRREAAERQISGADVWRGLFSPADATRGRITQAARSSPGGQMQELLRTAGVLGSRDLVVHIPPDNAAFWSLPRLCSAAPFFVPAAAGLPMVHGLPPSKETCPIGPDHGFGYSAYSERARSAPLSDVQLCERVREIGFKRVLIVEAPSNARILACVPERTTGN
jgi:hypothetical protein